MSIEQLFCVLEIGSLDEKSNAISILSKLAHHGAVFDIERLIACLIITEDTHIVSKMFLLLGYIVMQNNFYRMKILHIQDIYQLIRKIFTTGSVKKIFSMLNFLLVFVQTDEEDDSNAPYNNQAKEALRTQGCLGEMCQLFLQTSVTGEVWKLLCYCIGECCVGVRQNQSYCSHILPKCLRELSDYSCVEVLQLTQSLIENHSANQQTFVRLEGIQIIARNFIDTWEGLQLLSVALTDCEPALREAVRCDIEGLVESAVTKAIPESKFSKWSAVVLWKLDMFDKLKKQSTDFLHSAGEDTLKQKIKNSPPMDSLDVPKSVLNAGLTSNTISSSLLSKFDAVTFIKNTSQRDDHTRNKSLARRQLFDANKENNVNSAINKSFRSNTFYKNTLAAKYKEHIKAFCNSTKNNYSHDSFKNFRPVFTSTPVRSNGDLQASTLESTLRKGHGYFRIPKIKNSVCKSTSRESHVKDMKRNSRNNSNTSHLFFKNNDSSRLNNDSTVFKVKSLVKDVLDFHKKTAKTNETKNYTYFMSNKDNSKISDTKTNSGHGNLFKIVLQNKDDENLDGAVETIKTDVHSVNRSIAIDNSSDAVKTYEDESLKVQECTLGKQLPRKEAILDPANLQHTIRRIKIGLALYGCNFQKMSTTLWSSNAAVSPNDLYSIYREHIVRK